MSQKGEIMHNSNHRADAYSDLRRRMNEMNKNTTSCPLNACRNSGNTRMDMTSTPCNPEGNRRGNGWGLYEYPLAMVYAPYQTFRNLYECHDALANGTLFSELNLPLEGCK